jgi:hypothetical protein
MRLKTEQMYAFKFQDLEKLVKELYDQEIHILQDMVFEERIGHYTYHTFTVNGDEPLDMIGDDEIVKVWTETGRLTGIDMTNDPEWCDGWQYYDGKVEVKHILYRLHKEGHIPSGEYIMLVDW